MVFSPQENDIGYLVGCFHAVQGSYCIVRPFQYMDVGGEAISNEFDCPIVTVTDLIYCISSVTVCSAISVVHKCTASCVFNTNMASRRVEHEDILLPQLLYQHDLSNKTTSIACIKSLLPRIRKSSAMEYQQ